MRIFMWSGPRNISTALLRSFSNRTDTSVYDEPFYAYYLHETGIDHPMRDKILNNYSYDESKVIKEILKKKENIYYQKHMTHHILDKTNINWINNGINCFLIRDPSKVINSYVKKNKLESIKDIGIIQQYKIFNYVKDKISSDVIVINSDYLLKNPENYLKKLCSRLNINFSSKMLNWPKGKTNDFGIWYQHWYADIINSTTFKKYINKKENINKKYESIYLESVNIYNDMNKYSIK